MAYHFATVQQGSKEGINQRVISRPRGHDLSYSVAGYPRKGQQAQRR
jgi:hypothetical protein